MKKMKKKMKFSVSNIIWILIIIFLWYNLVLSFFNNKNFTEDWVVEVVKETQEVDLNDFLEAYNQDAFEKIYVINETDLEGYEFVSTGWNMWFMTFWSSYVQKNYNVIKTKKSAITQLSDLWISYTWDTLITVKKVEDSFFIKLLQDLLPLLLILVWFILLIKFLWPKWWWLPFDMKIGKQADKTLIKTKFKDVAWMEEVKDELSEIVDFLKDPTKYNKVWAKHPKWVLLYWPPGSGKTLLARAVAGEASVSFFTASWSEFMEMLVWMWAAKVRSLFKKAKDAWKAIIFIDEIDAIWRKRWWWHSGWHQEQEQTLNQILTEMDWFDNNSQIIVMAATNRPDMLDSALLRSGRFDRKVMVPAPAIEEREAIFKYYLKWKKVSKNVDLDSVLNRTSGLVWADIENIINEASLKLAREWRQTINADDFEYALEKVLMWPEKKIKKINIKDKEIIAYHELWHAVTSHVLPEADDVQKISIVRRWHALWATWKAAQEDKYLYSKQKILEEVISLLWWRASEEIFVWKKYITTWASNDFERATKMITDFIVKYWMDEELWVVVYDQWDSQAEFISYKPYSDKTAEKIDIKISEYMKHCYDQSKKILTDHKAKIEEMKDIIMKKEYLSKKEFNELMDWKPEKTSK